MIKITFKITEKERKDMGEMISFEELAKLFNNCYQRNDFKEEMI